MNGVRMAVAVRATVISAWEFTIKIAKGKFFEMRCQGIACSGETGLKPASPA